MTDWRSLRGSNFLKPEHLEDGPAFVTIEKVHGETMLDEDEKAHNEVMLDVKAVQRKNETGELVELTQTEWKANVVNLELMEALFGTPHIEQWEGKRMVLANVPCEVPGKYLNEPSIRVVGGPDISEKVSVKIVLKMKGGKKRKPIYRSLEPMGRSTPATPQKQANPASPSPSPTPPPADAETGAYEDEAFAFERGPE